MDQRISLITLGVADLARSRAFYEALGWTASPASQEGVVFFQANGLALALFGREALAADAGVPDGPTGFSGVTLAVNLRSREEVDVAYGGALQAGARALTPPRDAFWGGYTSYFADPDGHLWELAWNPFFALDPGGNLHLEGMAEGMTRLDPAMLDRLFDAAVTVRAHAYAPYSRFTVGAAVATFDGGIFAGCNVENASYPVGTCAEQAALAAMVTAGESRLAAVLIVGEGPAPVTPCGACRQRLREFGAPDLPIHIADPSGIRHHFRLDELLPHAFGPDTLAR